MKRIASALACLLVLGCFCVAGCSSDEQEPAAATVKAEDLTDKSFEMFSFDGSEFVGEQKPTMEFGEDMRISGAFCNRFMGEAVLADGVLTVDKMATTKMFCPDEELDRLERLIPQMLSEGAQITIEGERLLLRQGGHEAEYRLVD